MIPHFLHLYFLYCTLWLYFCIFFLILNYTSHILHNYSIFFTCHISGGESPIFPAQIPKNIFPPFRFTFFFNYFFLTTYTFVFTFYHHLLFLYFICYRCYCYYDVIIQSYLYLDCHDMYYSNYIFFIQPIKLGFRSFRPLCLFMRVSCKIK